MPRAMRVVVCMPYDMNFGLRWVLRALGVPAARACPGRPSRRIKKVAALEQVLWVIVKKSPHWSRFYTPEQVDRGLQITKYQLAKPCHF